MLRLQPVDSVLADPRDQVYAYRHFVRLECVFSDGRRGNNGHEASGGTAEVIGYHSSASHAFAG
jgi:hypothetical protein